MYESTFVFKAVKPHLAELSEERDKCRYLWVTRTKEETEHLRAYLLHSTHRELYTPKHKTGTSEHPKKSFTVTRHSINSYEQTLKLFPKKTKGFNKKKKTSYVYN